MATTLLRFNCVQPGLEPNEMHQRYNAMLERYSAALRPLLDQPPPDPGALLDFRSQPLWQWAENARHAVEAAMHLLNK